MENEKVKEFIERMKRKLAEKDSVGVGDISFETTIQNNCNKDETLQRCLRSVAKRQTELREEREKECFPIVNRGQVWYEELTLEERKELKEWYNARLDATKTLKTPAKPTWLK